jgi:hypothetical protein
MIRLMRDSLSPDRPASCAWFPRGPYSNRMATNATASDAWCIPKHRPVIDRTPFARPHRARAMCASERTINRLVLNLVRRWLAASKTKRRPLTAPRKVERRQRKSNCAGTFDHSRFDQSRKNLFKLQPCSSSLLRGIVGVLRYFHQPADFLRS